MKKIRRKKMMRTVARAATVIALIALASMMMAAIAYALPCLTDGYVFNSDLSGVPAGTTVKVTNLNDASESFITTTGLGYPPVPIFFSQYKGSFDCMRGSDLIYAYAENATHYGEEMKVADISGQTFINITLTDPKPQVIIEPYPPAAFVRDDVTTTIYLNITNLQGGSDSFNVSVSNITDSAELNQSIINNLGSGATATVELDITESDSGEHTINLTVTSIGTPSINYTYPYSFHVNNRPNITNVQLAEWNTTGLGLPNFTHYLNFTAFVVDLDGISDKNQLIICSNSSYPVNGSCIGNSTLCDFINAPVTASDTGQTLKCVHATNDSVKVYYTHACDSLGQCEAQPQLGYWCEDECNMTVLLNISNKTFDNSPSFSIESLVQGTIPAETYCYYKTDYDPANYTLMNLVPQQKINYTMREQNWSYLPTNLGRYDFIQHYDYYSGWHNLSVKCNVTGIEGENSSLFKVEYTQRDKVYYQDGDEINLYLRLEEENLSIVVNFSQIDSGFNATNNYTVNNTGYDYNITYNISQDNNRSDGQYNITISAFKQNGDETMNGSIFAHLHNNWVRSDIDNAFDCWSFKQGYYFDEIACDWESDLNHVADLVDVFTVEVSCFDGIDNDLDGKIDANDTDCAGQYYVIRRNQSIDSAFLGDPCYNNVCRLCLGGNDNDDDGICDSNTGEGVNVRYLQFVQPGQELRVKFLKTNGVDGKPIRLSVNYFNNSMNITQNTSSIVQLPVMELGGCTGGEECKSVTSTTFNPPNPDEFNQSYLAEKISTRIGINSIETNYSHIAAGKSIGGIFAFHNLLFFQVNSTAIINESDNATYCFDKEDNDLSDYQDCEDISCDLTANPANTTQVCEWGTELTCDDGFDNDGDGYTDCQDNDCFQKNGTTGPCYAVEDYSSTSCANNINDDFDWGIYNQSGISRSYEDRQGGDTQLIDCLDFDCNGNVGNTGLNALCEYAKEDTCNDGFDNDADGRYDCTGNAYQTSYERDCDRWNNPLGSGPLYVCPRTENICDDEIDNDLDSDFPNGAIDPYLGFNIIQGGWDCQDFDCDGKKGDPNSSALCEFRNETSCDDGFDNDADGYTDCFDPVSCANSSGSRFNRTGLCRPCPQYENITIDSCRDGIDTDSNGQTDCNDPDCYGLAGPGRTYCGLTETNCSNLIDDDYDGLIDLNDSDCDVPIVYNDETGPGQCFDGKDNDNDGDTDCNDPDCATSMRCLLGSFNNPCASIGAVGEINVCRYRFIVRGENSTFRYTKAGIAADSVVLKAGNINDSLRQIAPILDDSTGFMIGTTTGFVLVNDTYGLKAQADSPGFTGNLNVDLIATTNDTITPGWYNIFVSTSTPGNIGRTTTTVYVAENEPPTITGYDVQIGEEIVTGDQVNVDIKVNATDNGTFNSGIARCEFNISGLIYIENDCTYSMTASPGTYNYTVKAYDGAMLSTSWENIGFEVPDKPLQDGSFYNPYPANNYPNKTHFLPTNESDLVNIGVNFNGGSGYVDNATGCVVSIMNQTDIVSVQNLPLNATAVPGKAVCNGQLNLSLIDPAGNASNVSNGVYHFWVEVTDTLGVVSRSDSQSINICDYTFNNKTNKFECMDPCQLLAIANNPPILILNISNQSWPRGTKLTVIDLDDHFFDPEHDKLTFTWDIDTDRINVTVDPKTHFVTFNPETQYSGIAHITFYASDGIDSTPSNLVELEVTFTPLIIPSLPAGGGGGGGGGGAKNKTPICQEDWVCSDWGICFPNGMQSRTCRDKNECGLQMNRPETLRTCIYLPTCRDRIKNQKEEGVDCGGPCPPCESCSDGLQNRDEAGIDCGGVFCNACPTCNDNIQNQGEEDIDCGGPCASCSTCSDGIKNQGELNVDCGGPCPSCKVSVQAVVINWNALMLIFSFAMLSLIIISIIIMRLLKKKYLRLKAKSLDYYMRATKMLGKKKAVEKEIPVMHWVDTHLDRLDAALPASDIPKLVNEVDKLVRIFFKRVFFIRYAFTDEELIKDIEKNKISATLQKAISILLEELAQIKYGGEEISREDLKTLLQQVRTITERLVTEMESKKKVKISISEADISKIDKTLGGAKKLSIKGLFSKK